MPEQLPRTLREPRLWHADFSAAERPGYSGSRLRARPPEPVDTALGVPEFDARDASSSPRFGGW